MKNDSADFKVLDTRFRDIQTAKNGLLRRIIHKERDLTLCHCDGTSKDVRRCISDKGEPGITRGQELTVQKCQEQGMAKLNELFRQLG
jgi:hypothetical protein